MKNFKRRYPLVLMLTFCAALIFGTALLYFLYQKGRNKADYIVQDKLALERLLLNSSEIHRVWQEGEDSKEWQKWGKQCLVKNSINTPFDQSLLRCHPLLLECFNQFESKSNFKFVNPFDQDNSQKLYRYLTKSNSSYGGLGSSGYLFTIEDKSSKKRLNLFLADQCHEFYLENRSYAYGEDTSSEEEFLFDNFNQNIYIDQHLVTNDQVNEWIEFAPKELTRGLKIKLGNDRFLPATGLTMGQMKNFCSFSGKQLLLAHYFDAATFLPMNLADVMPAKHTRSPYFWTKKKSEFKSDCNLIFANECLTLKNYQINFSTPSWSGLTDSLGGVMEAFRNPIDPQSNLKASSYYFNFKSPWHKLGFRAYWDGEGFDGRHFDFKGIDPIITSSKFEIGFRCMREAN